MLDCLILGGGIIGLALAWELTRSGQRVAVVDRHTNSTIASWAAGGILPPPASRALHDPLECLRTYSHSLYPSWCEELLRSSDTEVELFRCGGLYLGRSAGERVALEAARAQWQDDGVRVEAWDRDEVQRREPNLGPLPASTRILYLPDEMQVRPSRILRALRIALQRADVPLLAATWNGQFQQEGTRWTSIQTECGELAARAFCVTAGPWSGELLQSLGHDLPIEPRRGQMLLWKLQAPVLQHVVNEGPRYLIARRDGHLLAGSTVEETGFVNETTVAGLRELSQFAEQLLPAVRELTPVANWSGLRPMTSDGLPYLDALPGWKNAFLAAGHFRSGIHLAPATARLMAARILERPTELDLRPFALAR